MLPTTPEFLTFISICFIIFLYLPQKFRATFLAVVSVIYYISFPFIHMVYLVAVLPLSYLSYRYLLPQGHIKLCNIFNVMMFVLLILDSKYRFLNLIDLASINQQDKQIKYFSTLYPIGVSFHLLQVLSIINDTNTKKLPFLSFSKYLLSIIFIPKVLAGPIERREKFTTQFDKLEPGNIFKATELFIYGISLKFLIANPMASLLTPLYTATSEFNSSSLFYGLYIFRIQLYTDFFGYFLMAVGMAKLFGIELSLNFNRPYCSVGLSDHWRRWNMTLGAWFRDYVLFPLSAQAASPIRMALLVTFVFSLIGIWHGVEIKYLIWGICNGIIIAIESSFLRKLIHNINTKYFIGVRILSALFTLTIISLISVFIRAESATDAFIYLKQLFLNSGEKSLEFTSIEPFILYIFLELYQWTSEIKNKSLQLPGFIRVFVCFTLLYLMYASEHIAYDGFLYFQF